MKIYIHFYFHNSNSCPHRHSFCRISAGYWKVWSLHRAKLLATSTSWSSVSHWRFPSLIYQKSEWMNWLSCKTMWLSKKELRSLCPTRFHFGFLSFFLTATFDRLLPHNLILPLPLWCRCHCATPGRARRSTCTAKMCQSKDERRICQD